MRAQQWLLTAVVAMIVGLCGVNLLAIDPPEKKPTKTDAPETPKSKEASKSLPPVLTDRGTVRTRYTTTRDDLIDPREYKGDNRKGIIGKIEEITRRMDALQPGERDEELERMMTATCTIRIEVYLKEGVGDEPWVVSLKVVSPKVDVPPFVKERLQKALKREAREVIAALGDWKRKLTPEQILRLKLTGETPLELTKPFEKFFLWPRPNVVLNLHRTLEPEITSIKFFLVGPQGLRPIKELATATPVVVEVMFNRPPNRPAQLVRLKAGGRVRKLVAQRVDNDGRRFMTPRFVVWHHDSGLPPEPPAPRVEGGRPR